MNEENQGLQGKIRIAVSCSAGESLLMPTSLQLQSEYPELQVDITFNGRIIDPVTEGTDLSLRLGDISEGFSAARPLGAVCRVLVASPTLLAKMGYPDTSEVMADYPFTAVSGVFANNRIQLIASEGQFINVPVDIQFQSAY